MTEERVKILGRRVQAKGGLEQARGFLKLVIKLRGDKPFIPKGVHRFKTFDECDEWTLKMLTKTSREEER
ncbi:MAG TPA: hypothetical protein VII11_03965 [Bacteroidota bacterium]